MKHTSGPWTLEGSSGCYAPSAAPWGMLAAVRYLGNAPERIAEEAANARLIAAAPDMFEALRYVLDCAERGDLSDLQPVRAALAKVQP